MESCFFLLTFQRVLEPKQIQKAAPSKSKCSFWKCLWNPSTVLPSKLPNMKVRICDPTHRSALQHSAHSCFEIFVFIYCARFSPNSCCTSWPDISTWTVFQMFCGLFVVAVMFFSERRSNLFSLFLNLLWWILTSNIQTEAYRVRDAGLGSFGSLSEHCTVWPWG